jgi:hypothetical protein
MMDEFEGMPEDEATVAAMNQGYTVRVTSRDGAHFIGTRDYRPHDRVNFDVVDGTVTTAICG